MAEFRHQGPTGGRHPSDQAKRPGPAGKHGKGPTSPGAVGKNDAAAKAHKTKPVRQKSLVCACDRAITQDELASILVTATEANVTTFLPVINDMFKAYDFNTCLRKAHLLTQVGPETLDLLWLKEHGADHGGYEGRGLLQLTSEANYRAYGKAVDHDFMGAHAKEVEEPKWAADSAGWYWEKYKELHPYADKNDLMMVCCKVNGGFVGYDERHARLPIALDWLLVHTCKKSNIGDQVYVPYENSAIHDEKIYSFAWGLWNDATVSKKGVAVKDPVARKAAYQRFLDLQAADDKVTLDKLVKEAQAKAAAKAAKAAKAHHGKGPAAPASAASAPAAAPAPVAPPPIPDHPMPYGYTRKTAIAKAQEGVK